MSDTPKVDALIEQHTAENRQRGKVTSEDAVRQVSELLALARNLERSFIDRMPDLGRSERVVGTENHPRSCPMNNCSSKEA
jgi:hypothetical protein